MEGKNYEIKEEEKEILREVLKKMCELQAEVLERDLSLNNQMIMAGIGFTVGMYKNDYLGNFEKEFKNELRVLDVNNQSFYIMNQVRNNIEIEKDELHIKS